MGKKEQNKKSESYQVYISGIPYQCEYQQLISLFDKESIDSVKLPRYQDSGRCRGYAHIGFNNKKAYEDALEKNGVTFGQRYLSISKAKGQKHATPTQQVVVPVGCKSLFIKNLPYEISEEQIRALFSSCGIVTDVRMVRNWANKQFKGFAYIDFKDIGSVKKAIRQFHNKDHKGRRLVLDAVTTHAKKGYKKRDNEQQQQQQAQE